MTQNHGRLVYVHVYMCCKMQRWQCLIEIYTQVTQMTKHCIDHVLMCAKNALRNRFIKFRDFKKPLLFQNLESFRIQS